MRKICEKCEKSKKNIDNDIRIAYNQPVTNKNLLRNQKKKKDIPDMKLATRPARRNRSAAEKENLVEMQKKAVQRLHDLLVEYKTRMTPEQQQAIDEAADKNLRIEHTPEFVPTPDAYEAECEVVNA